MKIPARLALPFLLSLALAAGAAAAISVEDIPSPRQRGGWSVDLTGRIPRAELERIDGIAERLHREKRGELAVVVVGSTGGVSSERFAHDLFNYWGIGDPTKDNGVLLFAALDDRRVEIVLGAGFAPAVHHPVRDGILDEEIVPRLRRGAAGEALREGARAAAERFFAEAPAGAPTTGSPLIQFQPGAPRAEPAPVPAPAAADAGPAPAPSPPDAVSLFAGGLVLAALGLLAVGIPVALWRRRNRCPQCGVKTVLLDEAKDDAYLSPAELAEERVGSVDYQIRACPGCGDVRKLKKSKVLTRYSGCPGCGARTKGEVSTVLRHATYDHGGLVRVDERCEHCGYSRSYERATPPERRPEPARPSAPSVWGASSLGSGRSSGGSGFGGGRSGASSGFGGGRSSGGGGGGRSW